MRSVIVFAVFALALGVLVANYLTHRDAHPPSASRSPAALAARPAAPAGAAAGSRAITVPRDARGHFLVEARVDAVMSISWSIPARR
jgi:predicted aspartyl protease